MKIFRHSYLAVLAIAAFMLGFINNEVKADLVAPAEGVVAIDSSGNSVTVWSVFDDVSEAYLIRTNTFTVGTGWGTNTTISNTSSISFTPKIKFNEAGDVVVIWSTYLSNGNYAVEGAIYHNGTWGSPTQFSQNNESVSSAVAQINEAGDIVVTWSSLTSDTNEYGIYTMNGSSASGGWNTSTGITQIND